MAERALVKRRDGDVTARQLVRVAALPCALFIAFLIALGLGTVPISPLETLQILLFKLGLASRHSTWLLGDESIVWEIRLPRVLAACLVGSSLSVAGALFQAVLRNPLADPYVIGTSAGAQLGVTVALLVPIQFSLVGFGPIETLAFAGALATVVFVYSIARSGGRTPVVTLLLAGFVVSSFLISGTSFLLTASNRVNQVLRWTMGSVDVSNFGKLAATGPAIVIVIAVSYLLARNLDAVLLGEEQASHLGVPVERVKLLALVLGSLLTALAVSLAGVVAFVGLVVPHTVRLVYGPAHRLLLPAAAVAGALFLLVADMLARIVVPPTVLPLGVVTAIVGAPFFLHLLRRSRREYAL